MSRCTGHCCRRFTLPLSPKELADNLEAFKDGEVRDRNEHNIVQDIETIAEMVVPLGMSADTPSGFKLDKPVHWYGCKHQAANGDCLIYERRPALCRDYPYGQPCTYAGCTWNEAKHASP